MGAERHTRGSITARGACDGHPGPPRVAYAVRRGLGSAVARNRVRRRLRAATAACEPNLGTGVAFLVSAGSEVLTMPFEELVDTLGKLFEASRPAGGPGR